MKRRTGSNIYVSMYTITLLVVVLFFAHNAFENVNYNVYAIEHDIQVMGHWFHIHDLFPFYDAPALDYNQQAPRMDIQRYLYRVSTNIMLLALTVGLFRLVMALNIFLKEIPGRRFTRLPYFLIVFICLFGYELLDFLFYAGQTNWIYQAVGTVVALLVVCVVKKDNANA